MFLSLDESSPPTTPREPGRIRRYLGPIIGGVLMIALLAGWAVSEWYNVERAQVDVLRRFGDGFVLLFDATVHARSNSFEDGEAVQKLLDELSEHAPGLHGATVQHGSETLAHFGETVPAVDLGRVEGESEQGELVVVWRRIRPSAADDLRLPPPPRYAGRREEPEPSGTVSDPVVILALEKSSTARYQRRRLESVGVKFSLGFLTIIFMIGSWALTIRNRRIAADLELERSRLDHLEELRFAAAGLAHETKNPLGLIRGMAQRISNSDDADDESAELAEQIVDAADRATERLGEFLHFARLSEPKLGEVALDKVLDKVLGVLRYDFEDAGIELVETIEALTVVADEDMLRQVLVNLLLNSLAATERHEISEVHKVEVRCSRVHGTASLIVRDTGEGIPAELRPHVFKPYVTGTDTGNGLGLAIVQRVADEHGWNIALESDDAAGTTITITGITVVG